VRLWCWSRALLASWHYCIVLYCVVLLCSHSLCFASSYRAIRATQSVRQCVRQSVPSLSVLLFHRRLYIKCLVARKWPRKSW
jgi:hypothetical protein